MAVKGQMSGLDRTQNNPGAGDGRSGPAGPGGSIAAAKANQPAQTTDYGAPIHTATGPVYGGIQVAKSPQAWGALNDQVNTYNDAATKWNKRTMMDRVLNAFAPLGLTSVAPTFARPSTYTGGDFHIGINPASAVAGLAGGLLGPGVGLLTGPAAGALYDAAGANTPVLTGPSVPDSWKINMRPEPGSSSPSPQQLGNPTQGGPMAAFGGTQATAAGGAPFGPQPTQTGTATPPAYGNGRLPNHSLPYGYQSLFPNSLSDEDKALLYAKALSA